MTTIEIDAAGKILGRLATQIAGTLRGKHLPSYRPDRLPDITVVVKHADRIQVTGQKRKAKIYYRFSGYPGGLKRRRLEEVLAVSPARVLTLAVKRMLPNNRSRQRLLRRLIIES